MKVLFISGPYRANTIQGVQDNIRRAGKYALQFWLHGWAVICPHKNTALFSDLPDDMVLAGDMELLKRCDAVFAMPGWEKSEGARAEIRRAKELGLMIIYDPNFRHKKTRRK